MNDKTTRKLKVYNQSQGYSWNIPTIILKGEWLKNINFNCGDNISVLCENNKITITKIDDNKNN